jgi:hypothetical protein
MDEQVLETVSSLCYLVTFTASNTLRRRHSTVSKHADTLPLHLNGSNKRVLSYPPCICFLTTLTQSLSIGHDTSSYELVAVQSENTDLQMRTEPCEETGNVSLPLSDSIIPQSFEASGTGISPLEINIPMPLTSDTRSPDSVEEITEHTALITVRICSLIILIFEYAYGRNAVRRVPLPRILLSVTGTIRRVSDWPNGQSIRGY